MPDDSHSLGGLAAYRLGLGVHPASSLIPLLGSLPRVLLAAICAWLTVSRSLAAAPPDPALPLTTLRQVRELSPARAAAELTVHVDAVFSFVDHSRYLCFLEDGTGGVFLHVDAEPTHRRGERVRLTAITQAGRFTPFLKATSLELLGPTTLPRAPTVEVHEFKAGFLEGERVAIEGRVVSGNLDQGRLRLKLATAGNLVVGWIHDPAGIDPLGLPNSQVRLTGICAAVFNERNEIADFHLHATDRTDLDRLAPPPVESPASETTNESIRRLELGWHDRTTGRVRCQGQVTLHWPGQFLFVTDGTSSLEVRTEQTAHFQAGDEVEVSGLRMVDHRRMILADATVRTLGHREPPQPVVTTLRRIRSRHSHADLVQIEGEIMEVLDHAAEFETSGEGNEDVPVPAVVIRQNNAYLRAEFPPGTPGHVLQSLQPRCGVQATGILAARPASPGEPLTYRLLFRSPADLRVLRQPSWWTLRHATLTLGGSGLFLASVLGWAVGFSQRRRRKAEQALRRQTEKAVRHRDALLELTHLVQRSTEPESLRQITELVARTLGESRVSIWRLEDEGTRLVCLDLLANGEHRAGESLWARDFGAYFAALRDSRIIAAEDAVNDSRTREFAAGYLLPNDIRSMLDVSLRFHGQPSGVLCIEHTGERRTWDVEEQNFAAAVADQLTILREATERLRAEEALRLAHGELEIRVMLRTTELAEARDRAEAADRIKSAFLATMSHELRTPLNSIIGFTGILLQGLVGPLMPEQRKQLGMVQNSAKHLLSLINDVLDISKIEAGQIEISWTRFPLTEVITRVAELVTPLAERKSLPVVIDIPEPLPSLLSDRRRVEQILINLLNNAIKFTEQGEVRIHARPIDGHVEIRVIDTGIGIRDEDIPKLFRPFRQLDTGLARHHEGTGLGLAICAGFAKLLHGTIRVESTQGQGSTFTLSLPMEVGPIRPA